MNAVLKPQNLIEGDYVVADLKLADWGNKEITIAETDMPGLMAIRQEFAVTRPLIAATAGRPDLLPVYVSLTSGDLSEAVGAVIDEAGGMPMLRGAVEAFGAPQVVPS